MKDLAWKFTNNGPIRAVQFGPNFFQNHHPDLSVADWFGKERISLLVDWNIVIHNDLLKYALKGYSGHIKSMKIQLEIREEVPDPVISLSEGGDCSEEVCIAKTTLYDITGSNPIFDEYWIFDYIGNTLPGCSNFKIFDISNRFLVGRKGQVCKMLTIFLMFSYQIPILGLQYSSDIDLSWVVIHKIPESVMTRRYTDLGHIIHLGWASLLILLFSVWTDLVKGFIGILP